ncbi:MAG: hypothetical protein NTY77_16020 [Elusimicrobia bacterium]|nr:hypothetical protein [Elusimicrobiota bacterium]
MTYLGIAQLCFRLFRTHGDRIEKLFKHKWKKVVPPHWREACGIVVWTAATSFVAAFLSSYLIQTKSSWAGLGVVLLTGLAFLSNSKNLLASLLMPGNTSGQSFELRLLGRRLRRATFRLFEPPLVVSGVSAKDASIVRFLILVLNGKIGQTLLRETAARIDLVVLSAKVVSLLASLVVFFGSFYWYLAPTSGTFREAVLFSLGMLSTIGSWPLPAMTKALQNIGALQVGVQIVLLTLLLPLFMSLYSRDEKIDHQLRKVFSEIRHEWDSYMQEHLRRFPKKSPSKNS